MLDADVVQEGAAFARGRGVGVSLRNGLLQGAGTFESEVIAAPFPFTHVGLHWRGQAAATAFEARASADGSAWTPWQPFHVEAGPAETPAGETFASLVGAPRHGYLQYRLSLAPGGGVSRVTATFLNSSDGPTLDVQPLSVSGNPDCLDFNRAEWGCDESLRFRGKKEIWPRMFVPVKKLVVHHTVSSNEVTDNAAEVRAIYTYHARSLGWGDIGYQVLIGQDGMSYEGRYGRELSTGREVLGSDVVGGHASAHNYGSWSAALIGSFHLDSGIPLLDAGAMLSRLLDVLEYLARLREIDPLQASDFLLSNGDWNPGLANVSGHRDCNATECPGQHLYERLGSIRSGLASRLAMASAPSLHGPGGPPSQEGGGLEYAWGDADPAGSEYSHYLEGWYKSSSSEDITYLSGFTPDRYPAWSGWSTANSAAFTGLTEGRYTFHVRRKTGASTTTYQANLTKAVIGSSSGGGRPGRPRSQGSR